MSALPAHQVRKFCSGAIPYKLTVSSGLRGFLHQEAKAKEEAQAEEEVKAKTK